MSVPDVPSLATIVALATIFVVDVATAAFSDITGRQWQLGGLAREKSLSGILIRGSAASRPSHDTDGMERIRDAVNLHRASGMLHLRLDSTAMPPRGKVECHSFAPYVSAT